MGHCGSLEVRILEEILRHWNSPKRQIRTGSLEQAFLMSAAPDRTGFRTKPEAALKQTGLQPRSAIKPVRTGDPGSNQQLQRKDSVRISALKRNLGLVCLVLAGFAAVGCQQKSAAPAAGAGMQGLPVQTAAVTLSPVPQSSEYVATIKSRRSATIQPQVQGMLTQIHVKSGDHVTAGELLMEIDPRLQNATVASARATERQKKAVFDYNAVEVERQRKLFEAGVTSRDAYDQATQAYDNSKADYESAVELRKTQEEQLAYYNIRAPFDGVVGDIPVHVGDFVSPLSSPASILTTVDENNGLEAYIYIPTERATQVRPGLEVDLTDNTGKLLEKTKIDFLSPQVDSTLQGILAKAPVHSSLQLLRNAQLVKARVIWSTSPMAVVPVLAVTRQGGQSFVFIARAQGGHFFAHQTPVTLGDTVGNNYSIPSGLAPGDKVIVTNTQFLVDGMPVLPLGG
jgi:RND family efflux transporter MFP subunit